MCINIIKGAGVLLLVAFLCFIAHVAIGVAEHDPKTLRPHEVRLLAALGKPTLGAALRCGLDIALVGYR